MSTCLSDKFDVFEMEHVILKKIHSFMNFVHGHNFLHKLIIVSSLNMVTVTAKVYYAPAS